MADKNIKVNLQFVSDIKDVISNTQQIQKVINQIKLPDSLKQSFTKAFSDIEKYGEKASAALAGGFKNKSDVTTYTKNLDLLQHSLERVQISINKIDSKTLATTFKDFVDPQKIQQINTEIETLSSKLSSLRSEKLTEIEDAIKKIASSKISSAKSWDNFFEAFKEGNVAEAEKALKGLNRGLEQYKENTKNSQENIRQYSAAVEVLTNAYKILDGSSQEYQQTLEQINTLQNSKDLLIADTIEENTKAFEDCKKGVDQTAQGLKTFSTNSKESAESTQHLNSELDQFKNRVTYFFGMNNAVRLFQRAVRSAFNTVQDLDKVMTETAVVTEFDVGDMWSQLPEYTRRANELGVSIHGAYEAATLYYQQGLKTNEVVAVSNETLKMARIAGLEAADATDRMTNALRGFNMEITEASAKNINDVYSNLAAKTASNVDEISTAMTKVASLASNANMSFENTAAFLSQIIETTRESAETAGTALKTVIARFSEVKSLYSKGELLGDLEGEEIDVNKISTALRTAGINLNEYLTGMKGLDEIFMELSAKWSSLDQIQQRYIATMAAGSRQQSRFIALMQDNARMTELVGYANNAAGASQKQFEKTLDSLETKLNQLHNAWNTFLMGIANNDVIKFAVDLLTDLLTVINNITGHLPGLLKSIADIGIILGILTLGKSILDKSLTGLANTFRGATMSQTEYTHAVALGLTQEQQAVYVELARAGALEGLTDEQIKARVQEELENKAVQKGTAERILNTLQTKLNEYSKKKLAGSSLAAAWAEKILGNEALSTGAKLAISLGIIGLIIAAVAALTVGIIALVNYMNSQTPEAFLERAEEAARNAADAAEEAETAYRNLSDSFAALDEKQSVLDTMAEGTKEWRDQVRELNQEVVKLADQYQYLDYTIDENGVLRLQNRSQAEQYYKENVVKTQGASIAAQQQEIFAQMAVGASGLAQGSLFNTGLGGAAGTLFTGLDVGSTGVMASKINLGQFKTAQEAQTWANQHGIQITINDDNFEDLKKFGEDFLESVRKLENLNDSFEANILDSLELEGTSRAYASSYITQELIDQIRQDTAQGININDSNRVDLQKEYAKAQGYTTYAAWKKANDDTDISDEDLKTALIGIRSTSKLIDKTQNFVNKIGNVTNNTILRAFGNNTGKGLTQQDVENYSGNTEYLEELIKSTFEGLTDAEVAEYVEILKPIFDSGQAYLDKAVTSFENFELNTSSLSVEAISGLAEQMNKIAAFGGESALTQFQKSFTDIINTLDSDEAEKFAEQLGLIDWTSVEDIESFADILESLGIEINTDSDKFKVFIETLKTTAGSIDSIKFDKIIEQVDTLRGVLKDLDDENRSFSKDSYDAIISSGGSTEDFVKDTLTGEYVYIGESMDKLREAIEENTLAQLGKSKDRLGAQIGAGEIVSGLSSMKTTEDIMSFIKQANIKGVDISQLGLGISNTTTLDKLNGLNEGTLENIYTTLNALAGNVETNVGLLTQIAEEESLEAYQKKNSSVLSVLAQTGDAAAQKELKRRAALSGMSGSLFNNGNYDQLGGLTDVFNKASKNGIDLKQLENYIQKLKEENSALTDLTAAQQAYYAMMNEVGYTTLGKAKEEWLALIDAETGLFKLHGAADMEVYSSLVEALANMLDVSTETAEKLLEERDNVALLAKAVTDENGGALPAIQALADKANEIEIKPQIQFSEEELEDIINSIIDGADIKDINISANIDTKDFVTKLQNMAKQSKKVADYIQSALGMAGIDTLSDYVKNGKVNLPSNAKLVVGGNKVDATEQNILKALNSSYKELDLINKQLGGTQGYTIQDFLKDNEAKLKTIGVIIEDVQRIVENPPDVDISDSSISKITTATKEASTEVEESKPTLWENPYDEIYAWQQKINDSIRSRKRLEREYQDLLRSTSASADEIRKGYQGQVSALQQEAGLQRELMYLAERKMNMMGQYYYQDSQGNIKTFSDMGIDKMVYYDSATKQIEYKWADINKIRDADTKMALQDYVNKMQELISVQRSAEDAIWDIQDEIYDLQQQSIDSYISFEQRVMDALQTKYTKEIDTLEKVNETLEETSGDLIKSIQDQIAEQRRQRNNAKTEEGIADKEARLAYLSRDTSGANDLEVLKLQKEIEDARLNYEDQLIDQALDQMQKDADLAAEQRAEQIQLMRDQLQNQIDTGALWNEVYGLINEAIDSGDYENSELVALLKETEAFESMSAFGQGRWTESVTQAINEAIAGLAAGGAEKAGDMYAPITSAIENSPKPVSEEDLQELGFVGTGQEIIDNTEETVDKLDTISDKLDTITNLMSGGSDNNPEKESDTPVQTPKLTTQPSGTAAQGAYFEEIMKQREQEKEAARQKQLYNLEEEKANNAYLREQLDGWIVYQFDSRTGKSTTTGMSLYGYLYNGNLINGAYARYGNSNALVTQEDIGKKSWLKDISTLASIKSNFGVDAWNFMKGVKTYATGGLADFTGPAWLDGSKTNPELVLNTADTKNFLALRDILAQLVDYNSNGSSSTSYGDTYYDIDINAEIGSDYDVDQLADRIKNQIAQDGQYRNVNAISFLR